MSLALVLFQRGLVPVHLVATVLLADKPCARLRVLQFVLPQLLVSIEGRIASCLRALIEIVAIVLLFVAEEAFVLIKSKGADVAGVEEIGCRDDSGDLKCGE